MSKFSHPKEKAEVMCRELNQEEAEEAGHYHHHDKHQVEEMKEEAGEHISWQEQWQQQQQQQDGGSVQRRPAAVQLPPFSTALSELMLCMGDWPSPHPGSVAVMEPVLGRELTALLRRAAAGPAVSWQSPLDAVHLLWATRRDGLITGRILRFLELRSVSASVSADSSEPRPWLPEPTQLLTRCRRFCDKMGCPPPPAEDQEAAARRRRLDRLTRVMSAAQYQTFTSVRAWSSQRHRVCRAWAESRWPDGVPAARPAAWHILMFVIKELVALLVDVCMLVRADGGPEPEGLPAESLTPAHAREAVRRLQMAARPRADMLLIR